jgi:hypothetical protein
MGVQALVLAAVVGCVAPLNNDLVGLWESTQTSKGGIGHTLEFKADGSFLEAVTVLVELSYHVENGKLFVAETPAAAKQAKDGIKIELESDALVVTGPEGSVERRNRIAKDSTAKSIVGAWSYRHYTGAIAYERYHSDGRLSFRLPMTSSSGCYQTKAGALTLVFTDNRKSPLGYTLREDHLDLRGQKDKLTRYRRSAAGPWYPRDDIDYQPPKQSTR